MRQIPELEAQQDLDDILDDVERGEFVCITRNGKRIACICPIPTREAETDAERDDASE
jgi:prevent-host-death family protein